MSAYHAVVWLDHREAHVIPIGVGGGAEHEQTVKPGAGGHAFQRRHIHHRAGSMTGKRSAADAQFYSHIVEALGDAKEWLVVGPSTAKTEFAAHVRAHRADLAPRILAVEAMDHPTDREIAAYARRFFRAADRMRPVLDAGD
jgi:hypothetical protein